VFENVVDVEESVGNGSSYTLFFFFFFILSFFLLLSIS